MMDQMDDDEPSFGFDLTGLDNWISWIDSPTFGEVPSYPAMPYMDFDMDLLHPDDLESRLEDTVPDLGVLDGPQNEQLTQPPPPSHNNGVPIQDDGLTELLNSILNKNVEPQLPADDDDENNPVDPAVKLRDHDYCKNLGNCKNDTENGCMDGGGGDGEAMISEKSVSLNQSGISMKEKGNTITLTYGELSEGLTVSQIKNILDTAAGPSWRAAVGVSNKRKVSLFQLSHFRQLTTEDQLKNLDLQLANDSKFREGLAKRLLDQGGRDGKDNLRRALKYLMTDQLATGFSWAGVSGRKGKRAFKKYSWILSTLIESIMDRYPGLTVLELEDVIKIWLKQAPFRPKK